MTTITPYHPPIRPSSIHHVALSSKSFRVFGLDDPAWKNARRDWKLHKTSGSSLVADNGGGGPKKSAMKSALRGGGGGGFSKGGGGFSKGGSFAHINTKRDDFDDDDSTSSDEDEDDGGAQYRRTFGTEDDEDDDEDEAKELEWICDAVKTALKEDAGGHGTAGFHLSKAESNRLLTHLGSVFNAKLIPHDAESNAPLLPSAAFLVDPSTGQAKYSGNDEFYTIHGEDNEGEHKPFQLRINISRAREGLAAIEFYESIFAKRKELAAGDDNGDDVMEDWDVDQWVAQDDHLQELQQRLIDAREQNPEKEGKKTPLGYLVEFLLVEPHVPLDEPVIAPPTNLDKTHPNAKANPSNPSISRAGSRNLSMKSIDEDGEAEVERNAGRAIEVKYAVKRSVFHKNIYASRQFVAPGPWEKANIKAYGDIGLDVRKSLVRVEFPKFPEGCRDRTFREVYQLNARLKSGSFATVCRGTHRATGKKIAVKCVLRKDLPPSDDAAIYDEVLILSTLRHAYICPLVDFFEERECYFLIMELMSGGDLFDRIGKRKSYTENDARDLCRKMLESLRYCHENSVAHCDMKPKNLLLMSDDDDVQMKLADFGFATRVYEPSSLTKQCGTPFFVAPEVLLRSPYDQQSDMWSCGVIIFLLLGGDLPFMGRSQKELFRNIVMGRYEFDETGWAHVSEEARDLVKQLLVTDPSKRLTSREAMASPWMRQRGNLLAKNNLQYTSQRLKGFNARMKLRASMIAVGSVVSMTLSVRSLKAGLSNKNVANTEKKEKRPSFLNLPKEGGSDDEEDED
eukprot:CAMPEP_0183710006 /NCGR_PEP_ID=MMETSP0737-20130205/5899_1 /TAXON_ID=385413 /ORGANISM="Thalassiosira miniscula, Strain CCMP1093" /LENGTH=794 /DNA_ID=CAMNT_0025938227 /DNA_START=292 /DNA_END=2676 /DNA_ORIENTATION=+